MGSVSEGTLVYPRRLPMYSMFIVHGRYWRVVEVYITQVIHLVCLLLMHVFLSHLHEIFMGVKVDQGVSLSVDKRLGVMPTLVVLAVHSPGEH